MALEAFYASIGGDLEGVRSHMLTDDRVVKFVKLFLLDPSYPNLCTAMEQKDWPEAFRAVHTLKGLAHNMGFSALMAASGDLTEALRPASTGGPVDEEAACALLRQVTDEYTRVVSAANLAF